MTRDQKTNILGGLLAAITWVQPYLLDVTYYSLRGIIWLVSGAIIAWLAWYIGKKD